MFLLASPAWAWIPIVLMAAAAQTVRNAAQRSVAGSAGVLGATLVRFLYGLPFALGWLLALRATQPGGQAMPAFNAAYLAWVAGGAVAQLLATAFLLVAMRERNFIIAVVNSKTEVLQVALFASLFIGEWPTWLTAGAMLLATAGVVLLSAPASALGLSRGAPGEGRAGWFNKAALYGLVSGGGFALANVGYRGAALELGGPSPWLAAAWGVLVAQALQSVLLGGWLAWRQRSALGAVARSWRLSLLAGGMGALASIGWFTALAMRPAADVRTLGLVEVLFSYLVSHRIFNERLRPAELAGLVLVVAGLVLVCLQL